MNSYIFQKIIKWRLAVVAVIGVSTVFFALKLPDLRIVSTIESLLPRDEVYKNDQAVRSRFGIEDSLIVGIFHPESVLRRDVLEYCSMINDRLAEIEGITEVKSIFTQTNIQKRQDGLDLSRICRNPSTADIQRLSSDLKKFTEIHGILISQDFTCLPLIVQVTEHVSDRNIYDKVQSAINSVPGPEQCTSYISGTYGFEAVLGEDIFRDLLVLIPIVSFIMCVLLLLVFRSLAFAAICLAEIVAVNIWTLGLMALTGQHLYIIGATTPVILVALTLADEIHIFNEYITFKRSEGIGREDVVTDTMTSISRPIVQTSVTTALAFLSFQLSSMPALKTFGIFTAAGVMIAMLLSLLLTPVALYWIFPDTGTSAFDARREALLKGVGLKIYKHPKPFMIVAVVLLLCSVLLINRLRLQDSWTSNFSEDSEIITANNKLNEKLAGTVLMYVEVDSDQEDGIFKPSLLRGIRSVQNDIEKTPAVGGTLSLADLIRKMNKEMQDKKEIPRSKAAVAQYFFLLQDSSYSQFWDFKAEATNIVIFCKTDDYRSGLSLISTLNDSLSQNLSNQNIRYGGGFFLNMHWVELLPADLFKNLIACFLLIYGSCLIFCRYWKNALFIVLPVAAAVLTVFGLLGIMHPDFGITSSIFSSIILGIGIDYVVHIYHKGVHAPPADPAADRIVQAFNTAGQAIVFDAFVIILGFLVLTLSRIPPVQELGTIVAAGILVSLFWTFLLAPFIIRQSRLLLPKD